MTEFCSIEAFRTISATEQQWVGQFPVQYTTRMPRPRTILEIRYGFSWVQTKPTEVMIDKRFEYPKELYDAQLNEAYVRFEDDLWDVKKHSRQQHEEFRNMTDRFKVLSHMYEGQKIVIVGITQDQSQRLDQETKIVKTFVIHLKMICHSDSIRSFFYPNLPLTGDLSLEALRNEPHLSLSISDTGAIITVDTQKHPLIAVHRALGELLLPRPAFLFPHSRHEDNQKAFFRVAVEVLEKCDEEGQDTILAFAREWGVEKRVLDAVPRRSGTNQGGSEAEGSGRQGGDFIRGLPFWKPSG